LTDGLKLEINLDPKSKGERNGKSPKPNPQTPPNPPRRRLVCGMPSRKPGGNRGKGRSPKGAWKPRNFLSRKPPPRGEQRCRRRRRLADRRQGKNKGDRSLWEGRKKKAIATAPAGLNRRTQGRQWQSAAAGAAEQSGGGLTGSPLRDGPRGTGAAHQKKIKSPHAPLPLPLRLPLWIQERDRKEQNLRWIVVTPAYREY
jgi:hypothetical protein